MEGYIVYSKMNSGVIIIGIVIVLISILIYVIKNNKDILEFINKKMENKAIKIIILVLLIILIAALIWFICNQAVVLKRNADIYNQSLSNDEKFAEIDKLILEENNYYNSAINKEYTNQKSAEPYIPEGFQYVEGEWNKGFVIQDENGNQYVWVPCTNKENDEIIKLQRYNFTEQPFISKDLCNNYEYKNFINSALENGGFYVSRFEIGNENGKPVSKSGVKVWTKVTKNEVTDIVNTMYENSNITCELINGYAYDTTLLWIKNTNEIEGFNHGRDILEEVCTGTKSYNNIYDFTDNIMELTSENSYDTYIVRGFPFRYESSYYFSENDMTIGNLDRFSIYPEDNYFSDGTLLGFRTIIYK